MNDADLRNYSMQDELAKSGVVRNGIHIIGNYRLNDLFCKVLPEIMPIILVCPVTNLLNDGVKEL
ncbi:hypothetical protein [Paenibacillus sp. SYP-B3998]|uniref:hypothetical protein n=1 Tax=Paenibacillus sp. SYP-B3998 TaxID=2678564 RepID=UPI001F085809|nr:hypothetical protein [Paenibacillus sp. SYP-B3998]